MALKGIVLTLDAVISLLIMITIISLLIFFRIESSSPFFESQQLHALSEDVLTVLSESTLREVTNQSLLNQYLSSGILKNSDLDKNAIDVIGALWSANRSEAANITKDILNNFLPQNMGYGLLINGNTVYNSSDTSRPPYSNATTEISSSRIASGYEFNKSTSGYVARAWATKIKRNITIIIPINLEWGGFSSGYCHSGCWANGYAPASERGRSAILIKNFTIPSDATIFSAYLQLALDNGFTQVFINGNSVFSQSNPSNTPYETNITQYISPGLNQFKMVFNSTINTGGDALAHFHPGTYMKIKYNTSEVDSGSNATVFNADWIQGTPAAIEIIPFFVNAQIRNVTAYVDVQDINAFLLLTLNYRYNKSNPMQNVLLYRNYPASTDCSQYTSQSNCQAQAQTCSWNFPTNIITFDATFDNWGSTNCGGASAEGWSDCAANGYWNATVGTASYNTSSTKYFEGSDIHTVNSTWLTKCLNLSNYSNAYITFWYNKTATSNPANHTLFSAGFDGWGSTNCGGASAEGWSDCAANGYWNATVGTASYNTSSTKYFEGSSISASNSTWITKCLDLSSYQRAYVTFWYNKTSTSSPNERQFILVNMTGAGTMTSLWSSTTSASSWTYTELNITNFISRYTCVRYMAGAASSSSEKLRLDDFKIIGTDGVDERQFILINRTGAGAMTSIWNSTTSASSWTYTELNITNFISRYTCVRYMAGSVSDQTEKLRLDDFKLNVTSIGSCGNIVGTEDVKNLTYEIKLNGTGTLINEYNSSWNLLNSWFNTNVTLNNIQNNMTNTLGIYADIRAPINATSLDLNGDVDWQRLGMYANDNTSGHGNDHFCFITDKTNVTVYHDLEQYGLEYGKVDITAVQNFTDNLVCCETKKGSNCYGGPTDDNRTCKDAFINLTFPFSTRIITSRVIGTEDLGGNDNGYNWVWMWNDTSLTNETSIVLDTDTPPGTFTYLPVKYFDLKYNYALSEWGGNNTIRVGDKDNGRWLDTNPTTFIGNKRSIIEYTFLIPSQVGYGDVFENQINATQNATDRLNLILGRYSTSADMVTENYSVSNVPYMWGPASIKVRVWA